MNKKPEILTRKLSALIRVAIADAQAAKKTPGVTFEMSDWLVNNPAKRSCSVCLAGAVMLRRGLVTAAVPTYQQEFFPEHCDGNNDQLYAINRVRTGHILEAFEDLGTDAPEAIRPIETQLRAEYLATDEEYAPFEAYLKAADDLEALGL